MLLQLLLEVVHVARIQVAKASPSISSAIIMSGRRSPLMRLSVAGREQQKNTNYAFRALLAVQLLSQVCGITATQLYEAIAVA